MKNRFQYIYSITVLLGVLVTSYLMMNQEGNARIPVQSVGYNPFRVEGQLLDPALDQLLSIEDMLSTQAAGAEESPQRSPSVLEPQYQ